MNIPEVFLTEPYNAYAPKNRKKHWHEIIEEQALLAQIMSEAKSATLPANSPNTSVATIGNNNAGCGGSPFPQFFLPSMLVDFTPYPITSSAPYSVAFNNTGDSSLVTLNVLNLAWKFGDGTTGVSANPVHQYNTTGSFIVQMTASSLVNAANITYASHSILVSAPTVTAAYTATATTLTTTAGYYTASAGDTIQFVNGTVTNNPANTLSYKWNFGSGSNSTSSLTNPTYVFTATGSYTVVLGATGSFGITNAGSRKIQIV